MKNVNELAMSEPWEGLANMQGYETQIQLSQPRPSLARKEGSQASLESSATGQSASKRQVSSNACEPCRKRKSKCDGAKPFCYSCTSLHLTPCNYDINKDLRRKCALRQEIQRLKNTSENYQFVFDSLCLAEEPHLGQLLQLIRSNQPIEVIADTWRSCGFALLDQLQPAPLLHFDGIGEDSGFGGPIGGQPFIGMASNQTNITISQSNLQANQPNINISASNVQINQPGMPIPSISDISGIPDILGVLGISGVPVLPDQHDLPLSHGINAITFPQPGEDREAPFNLNGWYDEWGRLWPAF